jgi:hypothetical protein
MHMPPLSQFFSAIFGASKRLSNIEREILNSVRSGLPVAAHELWDKQVQSINKVQRLPDGVEVNFYRMKSGRPTAPAEIAFANKTEELHLATVTIKLANTEEILKAKVWCVKGILFMIAYQGSINYFEEAAGVEEEQALQLECKLLADVLHTST